MFCKACWKWIDEGSVFCKFCGKPQKAKEQVRAGSESEGTQWEMCQIERIDVKPHFMGFGWRDKFGAEAVGPKGKYIAAETEEFGGGQQNYELKAMVDKLVKRLIADRWEPLPKGGEWWQFRFRRRIKK